MNADFNFISAIDDYRHLRAQAFNIKSWEPSKLFLKYFIDCEIDSLIDDWREHEEYMTQHPERKDLNHIRGVELENGDITFNEIGVTSLIHQAIDLFQQWFDPHELDELSEDEADALSNETDGLFAAYLDHGGSKECFLDYPEDKWVDSEPGMIAKLTPVAKGVISKKGVQLHEDNLECIIGKLSQPIIKHLRKRNMWRPFLEQ